MWNCRLFMVPPNQVVEHPPDLPRPIQDIPLGHVEGWECYAAVFGQDKVVGPFTAVVADPYNRGERAIQVPSYDRDTFFWYGDGTEAHRSYKRPCWYQSGLTLRFVRSRP